MTKFTFAHFATGSKPTRARRKEKQVNFPLRCCLLALLSVPCFHAASAAAQSFPAKPVRVIVPFAPGGATDVVFRLLAPRLSENLGRQAVIENRAGGGSATHMATELFKYLTGTDIVHVPYSGGGPAVVAVVGGQVPIYTGSIPSQLAHIKSGRLVALAVTSATPDPALPGIPTVAEAGVPGYEAVEWQGVVVPSGTPGPVIDRLNRAIVQSVKAPDFNERLAGVGAHAVGSTPAEFGDCLKKELATWSKVIKATGIKID